MLLLPLLLIAGALLGAFLIQPSGTPPTAQAGTEISVPTAMATATPAAAPPTATESPEELVVAGEPPNEADDSMAAGTEGAATNEVLGVRDEPEPTATPDFSAAAQCGAIQETVVQVGVAQTLNDVSVHVTSVAVYPIEYFICILGATGGAEADALGDELEDAEKKGATHAVVADLWVTNSGRDFGQLNMNRAGFVVAGLTSSPLAVLGSTTEVLITAGQGRGLTLVAAVTSTVGINTGPITLTLEPPLIGGEETAGMYQLFLPTP